MFDVVIYGATLKEERDVCFKDAIKIMLGMVRKGYEVDIVYNVTGEIVISSETHRNYVSDDVVCDFR